MGKEGALGVVISVVFSVICALFAVLIFAGVIKLFGLSGGVIQLVDQIIKVASIALGVCLFVRGRQVVIKGAICGAGTLFVAYSVFTALAGAPFFTHSLAFELLFGLLSGLLAGVIAKTLIK